VSDRKIFIVLGLSALGALALGAFLADRALRNANDRVARTTAAAESAFGDSAARNDLQSALDSLVLVAAGDSGRAGIAVRDVRYGVQLLAGSHDTTSGYPMMSVYKVPISLAVLADDAEGTIALTDTVDFRAEDVRAFHSPLSEAHPSGGIRLTIDSLVGLALRTSDNAASDLLLGIAGGPEGVNSRLRKLNIEGIRVDRSERELAFDMLGVEGSVRDRALTYAQWDSLSDATPDERAAAALDSFVNDARDSATPAAAATLFAGMATGALLPPPHTDRMLAALRETASPPRLRAGIPEGWRVWSKSGSSLSAGGRTGAYNDVALVELSGGRFVSIALFIAGSELANEELAAVARAVAEAVARNHSGR